MNKENTEKILKLGPSLFRNLNKERENYNNGSHFQPIVFGFECGDGWFEILSRLVVGIEAAIADVPEDERPIVLQVKEKFGGLRFYLSVENEQISNLIKDAEDESFRTCELCGKPGEPRGGGWITTLCEGCHAR